MTSASGYMAFIGYIQGVGRCVCGGGGGEGKGLGGTPGGGAHSIWKRVPTVHVVLPLKSSGCRKPRWLKKKKKKKKGGWVILLYNYRRTVRVFATNIVDRITIGMS